LRFIATIVSLCIAAVLLILGFGFKFFTGPHSVSLAMPSTTASYVVIDPEVLALHPGSQIIQASGAPSNTAAFGKTADVKAWLAGSTYTRISADPKTHKLSSQTIDAAQSTADSPTAAASQDGTIVSPAGSDMWLGESTAKGTDANLPLTIGSNQSVIVAGDGTSPAPSKVTVVWPLPKPQFLWMTDDVLMLAGGVFLLVGIGFYLWALYGMRRGQGPRRRGGKRMPKAPRPNRSLGRSTSSISGPRRGRRAITGGKAFVAASLGGLMLAGVTACSSPSAQVSPTPTPTSTNGVSPDSPQPVVTEQQLSEILYKTTQTMTAADKANDSNAIRGRFAGAALEARLANYAMRKTNSKIASLPGFTNTPVQLFLPQATDLWPRSILVMVQSTAEATKGQPAPTVAVSLTQQNPRANYQVAYVLNLEAKQRTPEVAASTVGAPLVALDTKLLKLSPNLLAVAYGDVLNKGVASTYSAIFSAEGDSLLKTIADERKTQSANKDVKVTFADVQGATPVAFATQSAGAIVSTQMNEVASFTPKNNRDLKLAGELKALAGIELANRPVKATYGIQLFFYVPPVGSADKIQLLGYTENLTLVSLS
jgi:hypothetical protein